MPRSDKGRLVGRYVLYEEIASGGMATVYLGRLEGPVGFARTVAIKQLHPHFAKEPEFVAMLLDEARLAARIRHPNVVPMLDVITEGDDVMLVMDYVPGETLSRLLKVLAARGETLPPPIASAIVAGVLHGLHAAHETRGDDGKSLGVVHRDVSPQNIIVGTDGVPRVFDFGVAKAMGRLQTTRDFQLKGKIPYMSPEQVHGKGIDRRTDIYAASVVLWEALTGRRMVHGTTDLELFAQVSRGCSTPPSELILGLPAAYDEITMRGLRTNPAERFATAREMARALEQRTDGARASDVSEWLDALAAPELASRRMRVAAVEALPDAHSQTGVAALSVEQRLASPSAAPAATPPVPVVVPTPAGAPDATPPPAAPSRLLVTAVVLVAALVVGATVGLCQRRQRSLPATPPAASSTGQPSAP